MFPLPCPTSCSPFLRHCVAILRLGRITPNATENPGLILVPCLQGGGSSFGDGAPRDTQSSACSLLAALCSGCCRAGLRQIWFED